MSKRTEKAKLLFVNWIVFLFGCVLYGLIVIPLSVLEIAFVFFGWNKED